MGRTAEINGKLRRIRDGAEPRVVDLFAGCGGASLGFQRAGCRIVGGLEHEPLKALTYAANIHHDEVGARFDALSKPQDVTKADPVDWLRSVSDGRTESADLVIGGPPCQAYSRIGRAKLREIARHPHAHRRDPRGRLWASYVEFVADLRPVAVMMENVPDILSYGNENVAESIAEGLSALGYVCRYTLLNAAHYGVPQTRERWFLIGIHERVGAEPAFPASTHHLEMPPGYRSTHRLVKASERNGSPHAVHSPAEANIETNGRMQAVTCEEALSDLPPIRPTRRGDHRLVKPDLAATAPYARAAASDFQREMREWPGFETDGLVTAQVTRRLPRDGPIFRQMKEGDDYPAAHAVAMGIFNRRIAQLRARGTPVPKGGAKWREVLRETVPPYDTSKFPNKWRKLARFAPSRTLMAHLAHDTYSHIHYDGEQARTISVREAARLQSFPDGFQFTGGMNTAYGLVGNAIPPVLAWRLASTMLSTIRDGRAPAGKRVGGSGKERVGT